MAAEKETHPPTGYKRERATTHNKLLPVCAKRLKERGYRPELLEYSGHDPDIRIFDRTVRREAFIDLMVPQSKGLAVQIPKLRHAWKAWTKERTSLDGAIYFVWGTEGIDVDEWLVDNPFTYFARVKGGPRPPVGDAVTEWFLATRGDMTFGEVFL